MLRRFLFTVLLMGMSTLSYAQLYGPPQFSITPSVINQGECYVIRIPNWSAWSAGAGGNPIYLNVTYTLDGAGPYSIYWWPLLDMNGNAVVCTDSYTVPGTYMFVQVSNTRYWNWSYVWTPITVNPPAPPPQPKPPLTFSASQGYAGNDCYTLGAGNAANMTIELQYQLNTIWQPTWSMPLNSNGQWSYCLNHYDNVGLYAFHYMKNFAGGDWVPTREQPPPPVNYEVKHPQPKWLIVSPAVITQGQSYNMQVGNGAYITLDMKRKVNGYDEVVMSWPTLGGYGGGHPDGTVSIGTDSTTPLGRYVFTGFRNRLNNEWVDLPSNGIPLTICPAGMPTISGITPNAGAKGTSVSVTITGTNLCQVGLSTTTAGLTFSDSLWNPPFTSVTATFNISASAPTGVANINLTTPVNNAVTQFSITPPVSLSKDYIYLGPRVIAIETP